MITIWLVLLGLCLGSFVNATVWRLHEQSKPRKKRAASDAALSIAKGRSMCTHCKHELGVFDLIPLFSWVFLRGKCRYCGHKIDDNPLVELVLPIVFVISYLFWPFAFDADGIALFVIWLFALVGLMTLVVYDLRWMLLPDKIVLPLIALGAIGAAVFVILNNDATTLQQIASVLASVGVAGGLFYFLFQVSKGRWIGGGDVKLGFALGLLLLTPDKSFIMLFLASLIGTGVVIPLMLLKKINRRSHVPFGPFLIVATIIAQLFGASLLQWYTSRLLGLS